jgi:hypothetical protein
VVLRLSLVVERDQNTGVQKRQLAQPLRERIEAELGRFEDFRVGFERDLRAPLLRRPGDFEVADGLAALIFLLVDLAVAPDLQIELPGQGIDDRDADAMEAARHFVAVVIELAARVQDGQHGFGRRPPVRHVVDRDAAAVVDDRDRAIDVNGCVDLIAEARERLVDRVVDDFVDEMMQPGRPRGSDVHGRPLADRLETLEDLNLVRAVVGIRPELRLFDLDALIGICHSYFLASSFELPASSCRQTRIGIIT